MSTPENRLLDLFEDLEQQAEAAYLDERDAEVADLGREQYRAVSLASRLQASLHTEVTLEVGGSGRLVGRPVRSGASWVVLSSAAGAVWLVALAHVRSVRGLASRSVHEQAWPVTARLGMGSVLDGLAGGGSLRLVGPDLSAIDGRVTRVGQDFVELSGERGDVVVALSAVAVATPLLD